MLRPCSVLAFAFVCCLFLKVCGVNLEGKTAVEISCIALLLLGLPHGTFDWQLLRTGFDRSTGIFVFCLSLYLTFGVAMFLLWQALPLLALVIFLAVAAWHFAEDWTDGHHESAHSIMPRTGFLSLAVPISMMTIPALSHTETLRILFVALTGSASAKMLVDAMILIAPVATAVATVKIFADFTEGQIERGIAGACVLAAMALLPPVIGFALYFCLYHSPLHFGAGLAKLKDWQTSSQRTAIFVLTIAALAIAAVIHILTPRVSVTDSLIASVFTTLSVLTLPHLLMPVVIKWLQLRRL